MKLDELRSAQAKERRKDSLQHLRDSFTTTWPPTSPTCARPATAAPSRSQSRSPTTTCGGCRTRSRPPRRLRRRCTYERRVGKVVKLASFAAADMPVDADGMTTEERQLFDDLVDRISENKSRVLDVLAGEAPPASTDAVPTDDATPLGDATNAPPSTDESATADSAPPAPDPEPPAETPSGEDDEAPGPGRAPTRSRAPWAVRTTRWPTPSTPRPMSRLTASHGRPTVRQQTVTQPLTTRPLATVRHRFRRSPPRRETPGTDASDDPAESDDEATADTADAADSSDRATVRITRDVGAIFESTSGSTTSQTRMS